MADLNDLTQNVNIWDDAKSKSVTVTTDGVRERLDVNADIGGGGDVSILKKIPQTAYAVPSLSLTNGVDYTIHTVTASGAFGFVQLICKNSSFETIIDVDGSEILRISQADLGNIGLLSSNSTGIPIYAASASKIFSMHPFQALDFSTGFAVKVQATSTGNKLEGWFMSWGEEA